MVSIQPTQEGIILNGGFHVLVENPGGVIPACRLCSLQEPCQRLGKNYCQALRDMTFHFEKLPEQDLEW